MRFIAGFGPMTVEVRDAQGTMAAGALTNTCNHCAVFRTPGNAPVADPSDWSAVAAEFETPDEGAPGWRMMRGTARTRFVTPRRRP